ncbi:MAG: hypothetical protein FJ160_04465 [Gammaproteobacteria bacterium]|nr:hypothetical protein [Gammaproteobacteria bacterium]
MQTDFLSVKLPSPQKLPTQKILMAKKTVRTAKKSRRNVSPWTPADEKKLKKLAGKMSTDKVAKALGRSVAAVTFKAFSMRVSMRLPSSNRGRRLNVSRRRSA